MNIAQRICAAAIASASVWGNPLSAQVLVKGSESMNSNQPEVIDVNSAPIFQWANGKGARREIAMESLPGGEAGSFGWRVGIAFYKTDAPFSSFIGVDRWIAVIKGQGITMRSDEGKIDLKLGQPLQPYSFPGEANIDSHSLGGQSELFNVLTTRTRFKSTVSSLSTSTVVPATPAVRMVFCVTAPQTIKIADQADLTLQPGQAALWRSGAPEMRIESTAKEPAGLLVNIDPIR